MKAIVQAAYGSTDVLELREIDKPVVEDDEAWGTNTRSRRSGVPVRTMILGTAGA